MGFEINDFKDKCSLPFQKKFLELSVEETFCLRAGNAAHIDVVGTKQRLVTVPHIELQAR